MKLKTLPEKVRSPYKKCSAVSFKALFRLVGKRAVSVVIEIVVIPGVKRRAWRRVPAEQELAARVATERIVIGP